MRRMILCAAGACLALGFLAPMEAQKPADASEKRRSEMAQQKSAEAEIERLEHELAEAAARGDTAKMRSFLAPAFFAVEPGGRELTADEVLARQATPGYNVQSLRHANIRARVSGDCAVVTAHTALQAEFQGKDVSGEYPYLRVWQRQPGGWRVRVTVGFPPKPKPDAE
jgi:ketosteroid isomerase-like protein